MATLPMLLSRRPLRRPHRPAVYHPYHHRLLLHRHSHRHRHRPAANNRVLCRCDVRMSTCILLALPPRRALPATMRRDLEVGDGEV